MKRICTIIIILLSQLSIAQNSPKFLFDYTDYSITNTEKVYNKLIESFIFDGTFFLEFSNVNINKLSTKDFDINQNKLVKKISIYNNYVTKNNKLFEIDFFENRQIKSLKISESIVYSFEYQDNLEIRKAISNGFENKVDSIFFNQKGKMIQWTNHSKNSFDDEYGSQRIKRFYDELDRVILEYRIRNTSFSNGKVAYFREISKFKYYKDSIVEKVYSNRDNNISLNDEKNIFNDTIKIKSNFKKTYVLNNKKQISEIIHETIHNDNSKSNLRYYITYNPNDKITSLKRDNEFFYLFTFNNNDLLKTATFVPDDLIDFYSYNKNGHLVKGNKDIFSYQYDEYGNWTDYKIKYENSNVHRIREIEYYK